MLDQEQRKRLLRALASIDKGEFRWELLTPWVKERALTRVDKLIICATFICLAVAVQAAVEPTQSPLQHLSYVANFFSYTIGNAIGYRMIAIVASVLEIIAIDDSGAGEWHTTIVPETYNTIFILVNLYYVLRWLLNRFDALSAAVLEPIEEELFRRCFEPLGVGPYQFLKLLDMATWTRPENDVVALTVEGEPVDTLFVSIDGDFDVVTGGYRVASIPPFQIIGEVAALENLQSADGKFHQAARATVLADPGSLYVSWSHQDLYNLQKADVEFARSIRLAISRTLSHKLGSARLSTGKLLLDDKKKAAEADQGGDRGGSAAALVEVLPVVAPDQERIYLTCFLRRGFDNLQAFLDVVRLAQKGKSGTKIVAKDTMLALAQGSATAYRDGYKLQTFRAPQLIGADDFIQALLLLSLSDASAEDIVDEDDSPLVVVLDSNAEYYAWDLDDVKALVRDDPKVRNGFNRLWTSLIRERPEKAQALIAELATLDSIPIPLQDDFAAVAEKNRE